MTDFNENDKRNAARNAYYNDDDNNDTRDPSDDFDIVQWIWEIVKMGIIIVIGLFLENTAKPSPIPAWAFLLGFYLYFRKKK